MFFLLNDTATTETYTDCHTLSLHDARPFCTDPLELPRHALEIIDRRSHPLPPFEALAGGLLDPLDQRGRLLRDPNRPRQAPHTQQDGIIHAGVRTGGGRENRGGARLRPRRGGPLSSRPDTHSGENRGGGREGR